MSAVIESGNSAGGAPIATAADRVSARAAAVALAVVVIAFGAAYLIGSMAKKTTSVATPAGQLAPASPLRGQSSVQIAVPGAAGAIPALAQASKPKPKPVHHAQAATKTQTAASVSPTQSTTAQSSSAPVVQQPVVQQPVVQPPAHHTTPPPVVVVHGG